MNDTVLVSLLLTLNIFHTFFSCFYFWLWTSKAEKCDLKNLVFSNVTVLISWQIWEMQFDFWVTVIIFPKLVFGFVFGFVKSRFSISLEMDVTLRDIINITYNTCNIYFKDILKAFEDFKNNQKSVSSNIFFICKSICMWCVARFGTVCTILKTWNTSMGEC